MDTNVEENSASIKRFVIKELSGCSICGAVFNGVNKTFFVNYFVKIKWNLVLDINSGSLTLKLLKSDYDCVKADLRLKICKIYHVLSSTFFVGQSISKSISTKCTCNRTCRKAPEFIMYLYHDYRDYEETQTMQSYMTKFSHQFKILLENADMSDALLVVGDKEFPVHKTVLAAQSPVFYAMFNNDMKEKKENRVTIDDVDPDVMKQLLRYVYTGTINAFRISDDETVNLLKAADKYALEELKFICAKVLSKLLTVDNIFEISSVAEKYNLNNLKKAVVYFMFCNCKDIINNIKDDPDLNQAISNDDSDDEEKNHTATKKLKT